MSNVKPFEPWVEEEIARLTASDAVALARKEQRLRYKRRQYMYQLRSLEKRGFELMAQGVTKENIAEIMLGDLPAMPVEKPVEEEADECISSL